MKFKYKKGTLKELIYALMAIIVMTIFGSMMNVFSDLTTDTRVIVQHDQSFTLENMNSASRYSGIYQPLVITFFVVGLVLAITRFIIENVTGKESKKEVRFSIYNSLNVFMGIAILIYYFTALFGYSFAPNIFTARYVENSVNVELTVKHS